MQIICFHNPSEDYGFLSNWYLSDFQIDGITFTSMEQYMMYKKAVCFKDENIANQILAEKNVAKIKELGRLVSDYDEHIWNGVRQIIIYEGLLAKFSQNESLRSKLLEETKVGRDINRHYYTLEEVDAEVERPVVKNLLKLMEFRNESKAFALDGKFEILDTDEDKLHIIREAETEKAELIADFKTKRFKILSNGEEIFSN